MMTHGSFKILLAYLDFNGLIFHGVSHVYLRLISGLSHGYFRHISAISQAYLRHILAEIDISVSKLLSFETFANFLRVSVLENSVSEKKSRYRFRKIWYRKKSLGIGFGKFGIGKKVSVSVSVKFLVSSFSGPRGASKM